MTTFFTFTLQKACELLVNGSSLNIVGSVQTKDRSMNHRMLSLTEQETDTHTSYTNTLTFTYCYR